MSSLKAHPEISAKLQGPWLCTCIEGSLVRVRLFWVEQWSTCAVRLSLFLLLPWRQLAAGAHGRMAVWWSRSLQPLVRFTLLQLEVSELKAGVETIWGVCFPPFPPALLSLKQVVWFHIYYFPCWKTTPTRNRIRELGKGRVNLIIGQTNIPSPRSLGFSCHFWCLFSINGISLACVPFHLMTSFLLLCCCPGVQISDTDGLT